MPSNNGLRKLPMHLDDNTHECSSLRNCASILRFPVGIEPTFIAYTYGAAVEGATMSAHLIQSAVLSDRAILPDVEVITDVDEATLQVVVLELLWGVVSRVRGQVPEPSIYK